MRWKDKHGEINSLFLLQLSRCTNKEAGAHRCFSLTPHQEETETNVSENVIFGPQAGNPGALVISLLLSPTFSSSVNLMIS